MHKNLLAHYKRREYEKSDQDVLFHPPNEWPAIPGPQLLLLVLVLSGINPPIIHTHAYTKYNRKEFC